MRKTNKTILSIAIACFFTITFAQAQITKEEKKKAFDHLKATQRELLKTVKDLSEVQLNFKISPESWSVTECVEHIAISENNIFGIVEMTLKNDPDPSQRGSVAMTDDQLVGMISSREQKVKTRTEFEPTGKFGNYNATLKAFKTKRKSNMSYVKSTKDDLRNRYFDFPFGKADSYQILLFLSGHTKRHTDQIKEVIANSNFPKS